MEKIGRHRPFVYGTFAAIGLGLFMGAALKAEVAPNSSYGQQLLLSKGYAREPTAFDAWYPSEPAPIPWMELAALPQGPDLDALDARIEALTAMRFGADPEPVVRTSSPQPRRVEPAPQVETRYPSEAGDVIYAADPYQSAYVPPPPEPPAWGWRLPEERPDAYGAPPPPPDWTGAAG